MVAVVQVLNRDATRVLARSARGDAAVQGETIHRDWLLERAGHLDGAGAISMASAATLPASAAIRFGGAPGLCGVAEKKQRRSGVESRETTPTGKPQNTKNARAHQVLAVKDSTSSLSCVRVCTKTSVCLTKTKNRKERVFRGKRKLHRLVPVRCFLIPTPPENATRFFQR